MKTLAFWVRSSSKTGHANSGRPTVELGNTFLLSPSSLARRTPRSCVKFNETPMAPVLYTTQGAHLAPGTWIPSSLLAMSPDPPSRSVARRVLAPLTLLEEQPMRPRWRSWARGHPVGHRSQSMGGRRSRRWRLSSELPSPNRSVDLERVRVVVVGVANDYNSAFEKSQGNCVKV